MPWDSYRLRPRIHSFLVEEWEQCVVLICCWVLVWGFFCNPMPGAFLSVLSMSLGTNCSWCRNMPNFSHTTDVKKSLYPHCLTTPALGEEAQFIQPFLQTSSSKTGEIWRPKIALEAHTNMGSPDHKYFEENKLCLKSGQLSHWCKHMDSICTWALEFHGYKFWQFAQLGCSVKCVPSPAQIQVVGSPLCLAHEFPSPALPTWLSAEHMHMAGCVCQMAGQLPHHHSSWQ